jgi:S-adenosylmethionine hydrolase
LEREAGLEFLLSWARAGKIENPALQFSHDATNNVPIRHTTLFYDDEGAWGKVTFTDPWGDIHTDITLQDMEKLGILDGKEFMIDIGAKRFLDRGCSVKVKRVSHFVNAKQGEWCAYDSAEGIVVISKNGYASVHRACEEANVQVGSSVHILRPVGVGAQLMKIPGKLAARFFPSARASSSAESITA